MGLFCVKRYLMKLMFFFSLVCYLFLFLNFEDQILYFRVDFEMFVYFQVVLEKGVYVIYKIVIDWKIWFQDLFGFLKRIEIKKLIKNKKIWIF